MTAAIRDDSPVLYFEDRMTCNLKGAVPEGEHAVELGVADIKREGRDVTLIAFSRMVHVALEAAEALAAKGISAQVVDPRCIVPLDTETLIDAVAGTGRAVVIEGRVRVMAEVERMPVGWFRARRPDAPECDDRMADEEQARVMVGSASAWRG